MFSFALITSSIFRKKSSSKRSRKAANRALSPLESSLRCGDIHCGYGQSEIRVICGKGFKSRTVVIPNKLKTHLSSFLKWKEEHREPTRETDPLFIGQRGPMGVQAIQFLVKKCLKQLAIYEKEKSVHALRHSYAVEHYTENRDIRALQQELGHASAPTTSIYASVSKKDRAKEVDDLWG
jgi:integrase/recombinase XerD